MARDIHDERIKERANFLAWLNHQVPKKYRQQKQTEDCFSAVRDFYAISDIGFPEKRYNLDKSNKEIDKRFKHVLGNDGKPCERCLRVINARAIYYVRHHTELFTEAAHKLVWIELLQRNKEYKEEIEKSKDKDIYHGDGLYLLQARVPCRGYQNLHETHLVFYGRFSTNHGKRTLINRLNEHQNLLHEYSGLRDFADFSFLGSYSFPGIDHDYFKVSSEEHSPQSKGFKRTVVGIVSRRE